MTSDMRHVIETRLVAIPRWSILALAASRLLVQNLIGSHVYQAQVRKHGLQDPTPLIIESYCHRNTPIASSCSLSILCDFCSNKAALWIENDNFSKRYSEFNYFSIKHGLFFRRVQRTSTSHVIG